MIKWGGRKPSSASSSSSSSFISHASPFSWLSKFKHMRISSSVPNTVQNKKKPKLNSAYDASPQYSCEYGGEGFCVRDDGAFCRQSFHEGSYEDKKNKDIDESVIIQSSSCQSSTRNGKKQGRSESTVKLKEKDIIGVGDERKLVNDRKVSRERDEYNREKEYENLRRRFERKAQRVFQEHLMTLEKQVEEVEFGSSKAVEKDVLQYESPRSTTICTPRTHSFASSAVLKNSSLRNSIVEKIEKNDKKKMSSERQNMKQSEELKAKAKRQKQQPLHVSREIQRRKPKQSSKVRIYSPRMASKVEICKIKAIEDMRKAKLRMKKEKEEIVEETPGLDSFAVIKCSLDPKQDFRDSMIEMIMENQISLPGEMEELLACYLTLNADEHHDLIIKVFRQVWFDMSQGGLGIIKSDMPFCCTE